MYPKSGTPTHCGVEGGARPGGLERRKASCGSAALLTPSPTEFQNPGPCGLSFLLSFSKFPHKLTSYTYFGWEIGLLDCLSQQSAPCRAEQIDSLLISPSG